MGASYGAGNYGMCGRAYDPRFLFAWPSAKSAVMGPAQLAGVLSIVAPGGRRGDGAGVRRGGRRRACARWSRQQIEAESLPFFLSGRLYDDGVIDPRDTRTVLGICLSAIDNAPDRGHRRLRRLPDVSRDMITTDCWSPTGARSPAGSSAPAASSGIETVAVYSDADADLPFVREADAAVRLPGTAPADTYLRGDLRRRRPLAGPAPTRCTPATASCPRTPSSRGPCSTPG